MLETFVLFSSLLTPTRKTHINTHRPHMRHTTQRLEGLTLGGRALGQMVMQLSSIAGEDAVKKLHIVLHVNQDQEEDVAAELHKHKWFG